MTLKKEDYNMELTHFSNRHRIEFVTPENPVKGKTTAGADEFEWENNLEIIVTHLDVDPNSYWGNSQRISTVELKHVIEYGAIAAIIASNIIQGKPSFNGVFEAMRKMEKVSTRKYLEQVSA